MERKNKGRHRVSCEGGKQMNNAWNLCVKDKQNCLQHIDSVLGGSHQANEIEKTALVTDGITFFTIHTIGLKSTMVGLEHSLDEIKSVTY